MKSSHHRVNNAKAIIALLALSIIAVIFYKFISNQEYFAEDPEALRNYVVYSIIGAGFLFGLLYLSGQTTHKEAKRKAVNKSVKVSAKSSKKKKK